MNLINPEIEVVKRRKGEPSVILVDGIRFIRDDLGQQKMKSKAKQYKHKQPKGENK